MSIYLSNQPDPAAVAAALANEVVSSILLLELRFASGSVYLSTDTVPYTDPHWGYTWTGLGILASIGEVTGGVDNLAPMMEYGLGVPWEFLSEDEQAEARFNLIPALVSDRAEYVNRPAILWEQVLSHDVLDEHGRPTPVGIPSALHYGLMDLAGASFSAAAVGLRLTAEGPLTRKGSAVFGRLTDRDQRRRHATPTPDKGLRFVPEVLSTNPVWTDW